MIYADPSGELPFFIITMLVGAAIGFGITATVDYCDDGEIFNGSISAGWYVGTTITGAIIGGAVGMAISYYATGQVASSAGQVFNGVFGKTTFYRTMSVDDYATLKSTGTVSPGTETFVSPSASYASKYNGVTSKLTVRNRTVNHLKKIGVRDNSCLTRSVYPDMPVVSKGWMSSNAYFKAEGTLINIGLGNGKALSIFNKGIIFIGHI